MPELDGSDFFSSAGAFASAGSAGGEDDEEVPVLEEPELPQPAIPNATRTKPSATHRRGLLGCPSDDFLSMRPPLDAIRSVKTSDAITTETFRASRREGRGRPECIR